MKTDRQITNRLNVDAILIFDAYWATAPPQSPEAQWRATCQPIMATAGTRSVGIGYRLPVPIHYVLITKSDRHITEFATDE